MENCLVVASTQEMIVLVVSDPGLRSLLTARLGLAGESVVTAANHAELRLPPEDRARATLVIEEALLPDGLAAAALADDRLRFGQLIVLAEQPDGAARDQAGFALLERRTAVRSVPALIARWNEDL